MRHSPAVIASLANYFGERELQISLYDPIFERLQLFEMLAQLCLVNEFSGTEVSAFEDYKEALAGADLIVVQLDEDSAAKFSQDPLPDGQTPTHSAVQLILGEVNEGARVLSLLGECVELPVDAYQVLNWPDEPDEEYRRSMPHQVLRWIRQEDSMAEYISRFERSPFKMWLEDPTSLPLVTRRP